MMNLSLFFIACLSGIQSMPTPTENAKAVASEQAPATITEALKEAVLKAAVAGERGRLCQARFSSADATSREILLAQAKVRDRIIELRKQQAELDAKA
jgi:hypothetical protein